MIRAVLECFFVSLKLGVTSFGGPVAHLGYFRETYVERKKWLSEERYGELVALTQFLPGPGSSQLGAAIGYHRSGWLGAFAAWLGFTLPSALVMILFAVGVDVMNLGDSWLHGLKLAAIGVVAVAFLGMRKSLCPHWLEMLLALVALLVLWWMPQAWLQPVVILCGACLGVFLFGKKAQSVDRASCFVSDKRCWSVAVMACVMMLALFVLMLCWSGNKSWEATFNLFSAGALVFGGGHVVLPLLEANTVDTGMMDQGAFLAGYGAAQAVPGPLFTLGSFLGASMKLFGNVWLGGVVGTVAIFLPGMILLAGGLPVWDQLKHFAWARAAIRGANATVVGVLGAALFKMLYEGNVSGLLDWVFLLLIAVTVYYKWVPVWLVVLLAAAVGFFL